MANTTINLSLDSDTLLNVIRAGLPHADTGMNISKVAASAATVEFNADGSASVIIPTTGLAIGAKGGGKKGSKKAASEAAQ